MCSVFHGEVFPTSHLDSQFGRIDLLPSTGAQTTDLSANIGSI